MASSGIAGLGITFVPSPPRPPRPTIYDQPNYPQQADTRHVVRHTVSYDVGLNRQGWDHQRHDGEAMVRGQSSDSDGRRVRIASGEPEVLGKGQLRHHHDVLSPLSDFDSTSASSDNHDFSPNSMSSLPSSSHSEGAYKSYASLAEGHPDPNHERLAQSMGAGIHHYNPGSAAAPEMETTQSRPYPPPLDFLPPLHSYKPAYTAPHVVEVNIPLKPASRLPAFLRERTREPGLARPQSMLELGQLYAMQAPELLAVPEAAESHRLDLGGPRSAAMCRSSTTYSGRGHEADGEEEELQDVLSPESIPSSAGGLQRRHLERQIERHEQLHREAMAWRTRPSSRPKTRSLSPGSDEVTAKRSTSSMRAVDGTEKGQVAVSEVIDDSKVAVQSHQGRGAGTEQQPRRSSVISAIATESGLTRQSTLLTAGANPARRGQELDRLLAPSKAGKLTHGLAASSDSPTPSTSSSSAATHSTRQRSQSHASSRVGPAAGTPVILEQAKSSSKARVELDLVLESTLVVEGGTLKGRIEIRVRKPKERESEVWLGKPKIRVVGFEELTALDSRHIFYHHASTVSNVTQKGQASPLPCVSSDTDGEGFQKGVAGQHFVPFSMHLPLGKGAKGAWKGKQGVVRYIVIASIKLKGEKGGDRSIAHFYRHVEVFPYLNPAITLAPALMPHTARGSKALFLGGNGEVGLTASIHRGTWVAGQRCYVDVTVNNQSTKRIKTLTLTLIRTTTVFRPRAGAAAGAAQDPKPTAAGDAEVCHTQSTKKKVAEASLEMGKKVNKGVTATGSWMGVEPHQTGEFSHSLLVPVDTLTVLRGLYLEVAYTLKVSVGGSLSADVSADLPIRVVNFVSLDPPPGHCGDAIPTTAHSHSLAKSWSIDQLRPANGRAEALRQQPLMARMASLDSLRLSDLNGGRGPSRLGVSSLSRVNSMDSLRTVDLSRGESMVASTAMERSSTAPAAPPYNLDFGREKGEKIVGRAKDRQIQHQMSLECISSVIASATSRRQHGHQRTESGLRAEVLPSSVEPEEWDPDGEDGYSLGAQEGTNYYAGGGEHRYMGDFANCEMDMGGRIQLDDLEDVPDDQHYLAREPISHFSPPSTLDMGGDSEDEIDAVLEYAPLDNEDEGAHHTEPFPRRPRSSSLRSERSPVALTTHSPDPNPLRSRPSSPVKAALEETASPRPKSAMKRPETYGFATPASPVRASTPLSPPRPVAASAPSSSASRPTRGPLPARPTATPASRIAPTSPSKLVHEVGSRPMTKQSSSSSLKRTSAIVKKPSTKSLRSAPSPTLSHRSEPPELDTSSAKSSPEIDAACTPPLAGSPPLVATANLERESEMGPPPSPRKAKSPVLASQRSVGDLRRLDRASAAPARRNTVILPSVRSKVAALESRQTALDRLAATSKQSSLRPATSHTMERANSTSSASEASFGLGDLGRENSIASFRAPIFRETRRNA